MIRILLVGAALLFVSAPAFAQQAVDRMTLNDIVEMYKQEFGQSTAKAAPVPPMEEIRPGGMTKKWDEKLEDGIGKHVKTRKANGVNT